MERFDSGVVVLGQRYGCGCVSVSKWMVLFDSDSAVTEDEERSDMHCLLSHVSPLH